jgi:SHS2 domain-containing protein
MKEKVDDLYESNELLRPLINMVIYFRWTEEFHFKKFEILYKYNSATCEYCTMIKNSQKNDPPTINDYKKITQKKLEKFFDDRVKEIITNYEKRNK